MNRQDRCFGPLSEREKTVLPGAVLDTVRGEPGNLPGGEKDNRRPLGKGLLNALNVPSAGTAGQDRDRQEETAQRRDGMQQVINDDFDIGAHLVDQFEQGQAIQGADRMVGDDNDASGNRDMLPFAVGNCIAEIEIFKDLLDEFDSL